MYKQKLYNLAKSILDTPFSLENTIFTILAIVFVRIGIENWINKFMPHSASFALYEFLHTGLFFSLIFVIFVFILIKIGTISRKSSIIIVLFSFLAILLPPIIDKILYYLYFSDTPFSSYYLFDSLNGLAKSFITFFGDKPTNGITYGTRIMLALAILFFGLITWLKTKSVFRTLSIIILTYTISFILSAIPSIIAFVVSPKYFYVTSAEVAGIIASPSTILGNKIIDPLIAIRTKMSLVYIFLNILTIFIIMYRTKKGLFISLIKNIRPIQTIYHIGLLCLGMCIALTFGDAILLPSFFSSLAFILLCIAIIFAWYSTVIFNDCVDQKIDAISNPNRPLIQNIISVHSYKKIGILLMLISILITLAISPAAALILIIYHALSFLYNTPPLRLKKFPIAATFVASLASFFVVTIGFITISPDHSLNNFPPYVAVLLIVAYTISLPIKDLKDIAGDKANDIYTIPVLFGEKTGRTIIAIGVFISFMLSVFTFGTKILLVPALLAGTLSFWTLVGHKKNNFIFSPKQTIGITFLIVSLYAIILVISFFF